jgi:hypothetical protein
MKLLPIIFFLKFILGFMDSIFIHTVDRSKAFSHIISGEVTIVKNVQTIDYMSTFL